MSITPLNLTDMIESKMVYDGERQKVLAQNIASKDVPGYKAQDLAPLDFANMLKAETSKISMAATSPNHFTVGKQHAQRFMATDQSSSYEATATGNTVVTEEQMMKVAQNAIDYQMSTNLYTKINTLFKAALDVQSGG